MRLKGRRISALGVSLTFHVIAAVLITWLAPSLRPAPRTARTAPLAVAVAPTPGDGEAARPAPARAGAIVAIPGDLNIPVEDGDSQFSLEGVAFSFVFDFEKIAKSATQLFPFLTGSGSLEGLTGPRNSGKAALSRLLALLTGTQSKPPLLLSDRELQALVDRSWSRRDRWQAFAPIAAVAGAHHADEGRMPDLMRAYGVQNGLQPYGEARIRDLRLWAQLGLAADHADFIEFIGRYAAQHPTRKTTTELLFVLDKLAQASLDALLTLIATEPEEDLRWTLGANHRAFNAIVNVRDYYKIQLERLELESPRALTAYYDDVRLAILRSVLRTSRDGYRASDARFLSGEIQWKQGKREDAVRSWSGMTVDPGNAYTLSSAQMLDAIRAPAGRIDTRRVDGILDGEQGRWMTLSLDRLRQFGYHLDTF